MIAMLLNAEHEASGPMLMSCPNALKYKTFYLSCAHRLNGRASFPPSMESQVVMEA